jgi:hypothetical protein
MSLAAKRISQPEIVITYSDSGDDSAIGKNCRARSASPRPQLASPRPRCADNSLVRNILSHPMNVSSTSGSTASAASSPGSAGTISQVQKQIAKVQKQLLDEQKSSDCADTKAKLIAAYQAELTALTAQLQQLMQQQLQAKSDATPGVKTSSARAAKSASSSASATDGSANGAASTSASSKQPGSTSKLQSLFKAGDTDGDGSLSSSELESLMNKVPALARDLKTATASNDGSPSTDASVYQTLAQNGGGKVTSDVFVSAVTEAHQQSMARFAASNSSAASSSSQAAAPETLIAQLRRHEQQSNPSYASDGSLTSANSDPFSTIETTG